MNSRFPEPIDVTALFDDADGVDRALDALYSAGTPRDLIEVVVSREAAQHYYASASGVRAPRALGRETWRFAGAGALVGFVGGSMISLIVIAWPGLGSPGGMAPVALIGPNVGTVAGAAVGAVFGALRRQRPQPRHARAAEAARAVVVAVGARSEREAQLLGQLLAGQGGRDVRLQNLAG
ncbi:MAG TPA: hypothetical protein VGD49_09675 [Longimicrobiales bacterium]